MRDSTEYDRDDMLAQERTETRERNPRRTALIEALVVFAGVSVVTWVLSRFESLPVLRTHLHLVVGMLFLVTALRCAERLPGGAARYGLALGGLLGDEPDRQQPGDANERGAIAELLLTLRRAVPSFVTELGVATLVCAVVFPPFVLGFYIWHAPVREFAWLPDHDLLAYAMTQVLVVGLPEEALFRGYLQGRLSDALPGEMRWLRVPLSWRAWLLQAALFALLHFVVDDNPARLAVFFPALLFGWLAALRGGIGAAILLHAACNLLSDLLVRGWL
jgi:membrane protease YdiL (CAAX protease family)